VTASNPKEDIAGVIVSPVLGIAGRIAQETLEGSPMASIAIQENATMAIDGYLSNWAGDHHCKILNK
jgi:hypothetical protein